MFKLIWVEKAIPPLANSLIRSLETDTSSKHPQDDNAGDIIMHGMAPLSPHAAAGLLLFILLGLLLANLAETVLHRYHIFSIPGSGAIMCLGIATGFLVIWTNSAWEVELEFDEHMFSLVLLPIVIFQSGYALPLSHFFNRLGKILTYAFLGTGVTTLFVGLMLFGVCEVGLMPGALHFSIWEAFAFASLISAIDPVATLCTFGALKVEPSLSITIMGESVINDAVSLALYKTFEGFLLAGGATDVPSQIFYFVKLVMLSSLLGVTVGVLCAFQLRQIPIRIGVNMQATAIILWSYVAYAVAEACEVSGIISSISAGILMNHYVKKNLLKAQREYINDVLLLMANFCEMAIFYMAGISIAFYSRVADYSLVLWTIPLILVGRALNIFPISFLLNRGSDDKITMKEQVVMWHAGLRGAIAFSIALHFPGDLRDAVIDCTSQIILLSVFLLGGTTKQVLRKCEIECGEQVQDSHHDKVVRIRGAIDKSKVKSMFRKFDQDFLQKYLVKQKLRRDSVHGGVGGGDIDGIPEDQFHDSLLESVGVKGGGGSVSLFGGRGTGSSGGSSLSEERSPTLVSVQTSVL